MATTPLTAEHRKILGRKVKNLRREGFLPANVYGKKIKSLSIKVNQDDFKNVFDKAGETGIVELKMGKSVKAVLISNTQRNPLTDTVIHVDFRQINLKEKIKATVQIEIVGESPAAKSGEGVVVQHVNELEVEALPADLPEKFEVDISKLVSLDDSITIKSLKFNKKKVTIDAEDDLVIVGLSAPQKEEEPQVVESPEGEEGEEGEAEEGADETSTEESTEEASPAS